MRLDDVLVFKSSVIFTTIDDASITSTHNKARNSRTHSSAIFVYILPLDGPQYFVLQNGLLIVEKVHLQLFAHELIKCLPGERTDWFILLA